MAKELKTLLLKEGDSGPDVVCLRRLLRAFGYVAVGPRGRKFDILVKVAVESMQRCLHVKPTGEFNFATRKALAKQTGAEFKRYIVALTASTTDVAKATF